MVSFTSKFHALFSAAKDRVNLCTVALLAWLSACDGTVAAEEEAFVRRAYRGGDAAELAELLSVGPAEDLPGEGGPAETAEAAPDEPMDGRARALAILGLSEGASADDVRSAYRLLAKVRHPDRFAQLGPSAVAAATESFKVLQGAYE